jgi:putative ATP-binding cassette transporter
LLAISPLLFGVAVGYAALGTIATVYLGRPLVGLNYRQSDYEAHFRAELIHVRENAESIAVSHREARLLGRLLSSIEQFTDNFRWIISVNRNLGFFTTGYNYLIQIIPTLIVAPSFIRGDIEFGVITQSAMAFAQLLGAFSLIVNQFGSISSFAAVVARLGALAEAVDSTTSARTTIETVDDANRLAFEKLTLRSPLNQAPLIKELSVSIPRGTCVLVAGSNEAARIALFDALAGIWPAAEGRIARPPLDSVLFLPQKPYLVPGTLRNVLLRSCQDGKVTDAQIDAKLHEAGVESVFERVGGLNIEMDWASKLSLGEQQQLALTRLLLSQPIFVVLDRASTTLSQAQIRHWLQLFRKHAITYVTLEESTNTMDLHDAILEIHEDGRWQWRATEPSPREDVVPRIEDRVDTTAP